MCTWLFSGVKWLEVALTTHLHLAPRIKKENSYTSTTPLDLHGLFFGKIYIFTFTEGKPVHVHAIKAHNNNNNYYYYLLQLGCYRVTVVILHVYKI